MTAASVAVPPVGSYLIRKLRPACAAMMLRPIKFQYLALF
jgi:hypothetical protein